MPVNILNLPGLTVLDFKETDAEYHVRAEPSAISRLCPHCGRSNETVKHAQKTLFVRDLPSHGKAAYDLKERLYAVYDVETKEEAWAEYLNWEASIPPELAFFNTLARTTLASHFARGGASFPTSVAPLNTRRTSSSWLSSRTYSPARIL